MNKKVLVAITGTVLISIAIALAIYFSNKKGESSNPLDNPFLGTWKTTVVDKGFPAMFELKIPTEDQCKSVSLELKSCKDGLLMVDKSPEPTPLTLIFIKDNNKYSLKINVPGVDGVVVYMGRYTLEMKDNDIIMKLEPLGKAIEISTFKRV